MKKDGIQRNARHGLLAGGGMWLLCLLFVAPFFWMLSDEFGISIRYVQITLGLGIGIACVLFVGGFLATTIISRVLVVGPMIGFAMAPLLLLFGVMGLAFYFVGIQNAVTQAVVLGIVSIATVGWCRHAVGSLKKRTVERRFIEKEFHVEDTQIVMRTPPKTKLDRPPIKKGSLTDKVGSWFFSKLGFLIPVPYLLHRIFSDAGELVAGLFLMSVLGTPLVIYILGRMACGFYFWIYTVWKLEKQHGKPVVFESF